MSLSVHVGTAWVETEDQAEFAVHMTGLNDVLTQSGLAAIDDTGNDQFESRAAYTTVPYISIHALRHVAAHRRANPNYIAQPLGPLLADFDDAIVEESYTTQNHLFFHSDAEGFYVPYDFPLAMTEPTVYGEDIGSSYRLRAELVATAPALKIFVCADTELHIDEVHRINAIVDDRGPLSREHAAWLALFEAARLSIEHNTVIVFA
jgi:hypothetical protein